MDSCPCGQLCQLKAAVVLSDDALRDFNAAQYVDGFDACTREVSDCLQSQMNVSPELHAALLSHLANCRRRQLLLSRSQHHQHATVLPPAECPRLCYDSRDDNSNCVVETKLARQMRAVSRSPLLSIANVQSVTRSAAQTSGKAKPQLICTNVDLVDNERTCRPTSDQTCTGRRHISAALQSDINCTQRTDGCRPTSDDVTDETDYHDILSLATDEDVTSLMWRPW